MGTDSGKGAGRRDGAPSRSGDGSGTEGSDAILSVTLIPDSAAADIFAVKCCGGALPDQNLEILIENRGTVPVAIASRIALENEAETHAIQAVCPAGGRHLPPGDIAALYTALAPRVLARYRHIVLFDRKGRAFRFPIRKGS